MHLKTMMKEINFLKSIQEKEQQGLKLSNKELKQFKKIWDKANKG